MTAWVRARHLGRLLIAWRAALYAVLVLSTMPAWFVRQPDGAAAASDPVDLVLWDPVVRGDAMLADWRRQHEAQLATAGRYLRKARVATQEDELLGFDVPVRLLDVLAALDLRTMALPAGSRVRIVEWNAPAPGGDELAASLEGSGSVVERLRLPAGERPDWAEPQRFEAQVFPRRSVAQGVSLSGGVQA